MLDMENNFVFSCHGDSINLKYLIGIQVTVFTRVPTNLVKNLLLSKGWLVTVRNKNHHLWKINYLKNVNNNKSR